MIIDGKQLAESVLRRVKTRTALMTEYPRLLAIVANKTPATESFLKIKQARAQLAGFQFETEEFEPDAPVDELKRAIQSSEADAIIVQLPLREGIPTQDICDAIPQTKDADVLSSAARDAFEKGFPGSLVPPVAGAVSEVFSFAGIDAKGMKAVVVGDGLLVGKPAASWLRQHGAEVVVVTIETKREEFVAALQSADVIVSGAGSPSLIKPEMLKQGVVLIDAGTSESSGRLVGDADSECAERCSVFTPVPGGVGPLTVAKLFENAVILTEQKNRLQSAPGPAAH